MKLFSKEIDKKLFSQYSKGSDLDNQVVVTKIFNPYGNGRWFLLNSDPQEPDYLWAIVQMGDVVEMGSVLRSELESVRVSPFRFPLERDLSFRMVNAGELFRGLQEGKFYKKGGFVNGYAKGGTTKDLDINALVGKKLDDGKIIRVEDLGNDAIWVVRENFSGLVIEQGFSKDDIIKLTKGEKVQGLQMMAKGGDIKNQYEGKNSKEIWDSLDKFQRQHFLYDHKSIIEEYRGTEYGELKSKEIIQAYNSNFDNLDKNIRNRFDNHVREGQYAKGGEVIKVEIGDKIKSKSGIQGEVYESDGKVFKLMDNYGTKSNKLHFAKDFKKSEVIKKEMAKGGGIYTTDSLYYLQVIKDDKEVAREKFRAKSLKEAKEIAEEEYESKYISKYGNPLNFIVSEAMEEGGKTLESIRKEIDERNMKIRFKIALVIGLDKALKYLDMDYVISPFKLIEASVSKGFITIDEIDENIWRAARIEADEINDYYRGSDEGIGSSDINAFVSNMLNEAGIKVSVVDGRYTRMAEGGFISYANGDYENKLGNFKTLESAKKFAKANKSKYESITFEDEFGDNIVVSNEDSFKDIDWLFSNEMAEGGEVVEYKTIASFDDSSIIIYDGNLGYSDILKLTNKLPKKLKIIQVVLKDSNSLNALTEWSKKQVKKTFNSDFEEGFPIIYSIKEKGEINIQKAYGELKNGKKVIFDVDGLTWEEGEIELKDGGEIDSESMRLADNPNWTNDKLKVEYDSLKKDLQNFNNGLLKPSKVIGTGYKSSAIAKRLAKEWLEKNIATYKKALEIRGVMAKGGKLIGKQKNLDVNKNGKLDAQDFKMLRKGKMAMGGETKFKDKVQSIKASLLKRKKVSPSVQKDYGKTYSPKEAEDSAKRIVGSMVKKKDKMAKGGLVSNKPKFKKFMELEDRAKDSMYKPSNVNNFSKWNEGVGMKFRNKWNKMVLELRGYNDSEGSKKDTKPEWIKFVEEQGLVEDYDFGDVLA
jgi:hypothetical protein